MNAPATSLSKPVADARRALLEIRHARLRLRILDCELEWTAVQLAAGRLDPDAALAMLDAGLDAFAEGGAP